MDEKLPAVLYWTYYHDGTVETNCPPSPPQPPPSPKERQLLDIDKLIAESDGLYRLWWVMWKRNHPETCLITKQEPELPQPKKPSKPIYQKLSCKRCNRSWTSRSKEPPVQCPKCHSPYWNRERKKEM